MRNIQFFIFIHGAWHASWCWERIAIHLRSLGHHVLTPDLPGHGSKIRPATSVKFCDYVSSIIDLIKQQPQQVILIGHSMAGLVISQIAEIIPNHIRELVFVAGYIPKDTESLLSIAERCKSEAVSPLLIIDQVKQEIRLKHTSELANTFFNCCNQKDTQYAMKKLQPQPMQPFTEQIRVGKHFNRIPKRSLVCRYDRALVLNDQLNMSQVVTDKIILLDADHSAYYSAEHDIIKALLT